MTEPGHTTTGHHHHQPPREYQLVYYCPQESNGPLPQPLPKCTDKLPWEKRADAERERQEKRKKQPQQIPKKKTVLSALGNAVVSVANATVDAFSDITGEIRDSQSPGADKRFQKYFPGFPQEVVLGEYAGRLVTSPESVMTGTLYITSSFLAFYGKNDGYYSLVMLSLKTIGSIQKAIVSKPPAGVPAHYPPQFNIVVGGEFSAADEARYPKIDSLVIYTVDNMQHMFYNIKHFEEFYCILDHAWRNPEPVYNAVNGDASVPEYASPHALQQSLAMQTAAQSQLVIQRQQAHEEQLRQHQEFYQQQQLLEQQQQQQQQQQAALQQQSQPAPSSFPQQLQHPVLSTSGSIYEQQQHLIQQQISLLQQMMQNYLTISNENPAAVTPQQTTDYYQHQQQEMQLRMELLKLQQEQLQRNLQFNMQ